MRQRTSSGEEIEGSTIQPRSLQQLVTVVATNDKWSEARPRLSILVPFFDDDPSDLLHLLDIVDDSQIGRSADASHHIEVLLLDDGSTNLALAVEVGTEVVAAGRPMCLLRHAENQGRAIARNTLASAARADHVLFLDADMAPDRPDFVDEWCRLVDDRNPSLAFGGLSLDQTPADVHRKLHRTLATTGDCIPAAVRRLSPARHVFTSNLLVRRTVLESQGFDTSFTGWGWEDVEWAIRVAREHDVVHVDIPASHLGLDTDARLIAKFGESATNFGRLVARHLDVVRDYPVYRAARVMSYVPCRGTIGRLCARIAVMPRVPVRVRATATRWYRAVLYAEVV